MPQRPEGNFFRASEKRLLFCGECGIIKMFSGVCRCLARARGGMKSRLPQLRGYSTVGSAIRSQRIGQGFESPYLHQVAARRIMKQLELAQAVFFYARASRAVEPALGQGMARSMCHSQARKRSKPHRGFAKKALSRPCAIPKLESGQSPTGALPRKRFLALFPANLLLTQDLCGSP